MHRARACRTYSRCSAADAPHLPPRSPLQLQVQAPSQPPGEGGPSAGPGAVVPPPPPGHPAPGSLDPLDLGLERKLLEDLAPTSTSGSGGQGGGSNGGAAGLQVGGQVASVAYLPAVSLPLLLLLSCAALYPPTHHRHIPASHFNQHSTTQGHPQWEDPYDILLRRYTAQGFSRDEVAMGLAVVGPEAHDDSQKIGKNRRSLGRRGWTVRC